MSAAALFLLCPAFGPDDDCNDSCHTGCEPGSRDVRHSSSSLSPGLVARNTARVLAERSADHTALIVLSIGAHGREPQERYGCGRRVAALVEIDDVVVVGRASRDPGAPRQTC